LIMISEYLFFFVSFRFLMLTSGSCYIHCINVASEMNAGTSILFTSLKFHMENTDSVNELRSCIVISPCLHQYILGSRDDRKTKYTAIYWVCLWNTCMRVETRLAESMINSCHHCYFLIYRHKRHGRHKHYSACVSLQKKKRKKKKWPGLDSMVCPGEFKVSINNEN